MYSCKIIDEKNILRSVSNIYCSSDKFSKIPPSTRVARFSFKKGRLPVFFKKRKIFVDKFSFKKHKKIQIV
jgi:hypothetical protein